MAAAPWVRRAPRRLVETGVVVVAMMLAAGVTTGILLARNDPGANPVDRLADGLVWLRDLTRGEAVQVNPATGREENRLAVAPASQNWQLSQRGGLLVVTTADGTVTLIDTATLTTAGSHASGPTTTVLLDEHQLYVANRTAGTITRLDPTTAAAQGKPFTAPAPLASATIDGTGTVWALDTAGTLHRLAFSGASLTPAAPAIAVPAGPTSALVAHPAGVTVLSPEHRLATFVGTETVTVAAPGLAAPLLAARRAPADLVPATVDATPALVVVSRSAATTVDTDRHDCARPGRPTVHNGQIYVPCRGAGRVIILDATGSRASPDLELGAGGDPELSQYAGNLYATVISPDGPVDGYVVDAHGTPTPLDLVVATASAPGPRAPASTRPASPRPGGPGPTSPVPASPGPSSSPDPSGDPEPQPADGDPVVTGISVTTNCAQAPCRILRYQFSAQVDPPAWWGDRPGTCTVVVDYYGGGAKTTKPMACSGAQTVFLLIGDGGTYRVRARFCDALCVDSNSIDFYADPPEAMGEWCGEHRC